MKIGGRKKRKSSGKGLVVFDLETTGKDPETDRIVQFAACRYGDLTKSQRPQAEIDLLINPEKPISEEAKAVHGILEVDLIQAPIFATVAEQVKTFIGACDLGGHNILVYDVPILLKEFRRVGVEFSLDGRRLIDSLVLFRHMVPHTLEGAYKFFTGNDIVGAHNAKCDVVASSAVIAGELVANKWSLDSAHEISMGGRLTLDGKILQGDHGPILNFGQYRNEYLGDLARSNPGLLRWVISKDFSAETKTYMLRALNLEFSAVKFAMKKEEGENGKLSC